MSVYRQKKIAMINDLSGYGRCSLTVAIPILSAMKVQCCPVPTSILSNHTGFPQYFFDDYSSKMPCYLEKWKELGLTFDGIVSGFLGSEVQIEIVMDAIRQFGGQGRTVIIDPIMGDHGEPYATYTPAMCRRMGELASKGSIVTPNLTEACILTGKAYREKGWQKEELASLARDIQALGPASVVITGVSQGDYLMNVVADGDAPAAFPKMKRVGRERPGTGDVFSSIIAAAAVRGWRLEASVRLAASFVKECIRKSEELQIPVENGVCFEELMHVLVNAVSPVHERTALADRGSHNGD